MTYKPTVVKDGVDFDQFRNGYSAKEVEVDDQASNFAINNYGENEKEEQNEQNNK